MNIKLEFLFLIFINVLSAGISIGGIIATIKFLGDKFDDYKKETNSHFDRLEKKQDKHNNIIERMVRVEESTKSAHHRLDAFDPIKDILRK